MEIRRFLRAGTFPENTSVAREALDSNDIISTDIPEEGPLFPLLASESIHQRAPKARVIVDGISWDRWKYRFLFLASFSFFVSELI